MRATALLVCAAVALVPQRPETPPQRLTAVPRLNNPNLGKNGEVRIEATPSARTGLPIGSGELGSMAFEGDYVVHYERGVARYAGRVQGEHDSSSSEPPILLRFADKTVALEHAEAARQRREVDGLLRRVEVGLVRLVGSVCLPEETVQTRHY